MEKIKKANIEIQSENYNPSSTSKISIELNTSLAKTTKQENENDPNDADTLFIKFKSKKKVPESLKNYIQTNLGNFELIENEDEKIFIFELKINEIDFVSIQEAYESYFSKNLSNFLLEFKYENSQNLQELLAQLKKYHRIPFMFHMLEKSKLNININSFEKIFDSLSKYLSSLNLHSFTALFNIINLVDGLKLDVLNKGIEKHNHQFFESMDWDQRGVYQQICLAFENPINNFIFDEEVADQELVISGKILGILNYEFKAKLGNMREFFDGVKELC